MIDNRELYVKALNTYGFPAQAMMMIEECSELVNALCKYDRGRITEEDIITEIADVMIMCEQMAVNFGENKVLAEKSKKQERLKERLSKHNN